MTSASSTQLTGWHDRYGQSFDREVRACVVSVVSPALMILVVIGYQLPAGAVDCLSGATMSETVALAAPMSADAVRAKLAKAGISQRDVDDAVAWARSCKAA